MKRYHVFTTWGYEVCKPGFDTLSEAVEKAGEVFSFTFMLGGEEMVLYVECHNGEKKTTCGDGASRGKGRHA